MKCIKKSLILTLFCFLLYNASSFNVLASSNVYNEPPALSASSKLEKVMSDEHKAADKYNQEMFKKIQDNVDSQSAQIKEDYNQKRATDIHNRAISIRNISTAILIITPFFWITVIIIIIAAVRNYLKKRRL